MNIFSFIHIPSNLTPGLTAGDFALTQHPKVSPGADAGTDGAPQRRVAAHAGDAFVAAAMSAESHGAGSVYILTNATAFPKCIYTLSMLFTHMFNKSLFII